MYFPSQNLLHTFTCSVAIFPAGSILLTAWPLTSLASSLPQSCPPCLSHSHWVYPGPGPCSWRELRCLPLPTPPVVPALCLARGPWPGTPSVHRPSPHPPRPPRQLGLPGGLTHLLPALALLHRCAHLAKPCLHPPLASSHLPLPQALSCSGGQASLAGSTRCTLSPAGGLRFPPSLPPSALASILHSGSFPSAYKWEFFPPPCPCLWSCRRFVYGHRLWCFSPGFLSLAPCSGSRPHLSISPRSIRCHLF